MDYRNFSTLRVEVDEGVATVTMDHGEINYFVSCLARRIAGFPAGTIAAAKQAASMGEDGLEDELVRDEAIFLEAAQSPPARRRMAAALAIGMQTAPVERCCFNHVWGPVAGQ